ncbi:MAG: AraC family transcriptional regulator [Butyrivibrio sp.]|nr:AraC family transcriptional regulator [Butyrivibrio sp.]
MDYSVYESINKKNKVPINSFVASIRVSTVHWHGEYELVGVLRGKIAAKIGAEEYLLSEGDLVLVNPNEMHSYRSIDDNECLCMFLQFEESLLENDDGEIRFYLNSASGEEIDCGYKYIYGLLARIVYEDINGGNSSPLRLKSLIYKLLADLMDYVVYDKHYRDSETIDEKKLVVAAIDNFKINLNDPEVLEDSCKKFGVSRKTLDRNFNSILGVSAKSILADLKIDRAKELLKNTDKNMGYIMDSCGFGSEKTFYRVFKEATGMTPLDFRQVGVVTEKMGTFNGYLDYNHIKAREMLKEIFNSYNGEYINVLQKRLEEI